MILGTAGISKLINTEWSFPRLSARSSGVVESSRSGGGSDSELSPSADDTDEPRRRKSLRSGNFRHGQQTLQLGSPSGGVNFFNAICRLLMYEWSFSTRFSDLLISRACSWSPGIRTEKRPTSGTKSIYLHSPDWEPESRNSTVKRSRSDDKIFSNVKTKRL